LKRGGQPEEVVELAAFLSTERASYILAAVIPVDGAMTEH
jgi:NAD(P)-dependent dehydrogenase (short-subunit alcohol dehydrogenase family)